MKPTPAQAQVLFEAEQREVAECMRQRGFDYTTEPFTPDDDLAGPVSRPKPGDIESAASVGYGLADAFEYGDVPVTAALNEARQQSLPPERRAAFQAALFGAEPGARSGNRDVITVSVGDGAVYTWDATSCYSRARAALYGNELRYVELDDARVELTNQAHALVRTRPEYTSAVESWRECMRRQQMPYEYPGEAARVLAAEYQAGKLRTDDLRLRETEVAVADARCYRAADLPAIVDRVQLDTQAEVTAGALDVVLAFEKMLKDALARIRENQGTDSARVRKQ